MLFSRALLASALAALASAQSTPTLTITSEAQITKLANDLEAYGESISNQPEFKSITSVLATALPDTQSNVFEALTAPGALGSAVLSALPSDGSYLSSVALAEQSILTKDLQGPAPTNKPLAMAAGVAAAGAGVVAMVL